MKKKKKDLLKNISNEKLLLLGLGRIIMSSNLKFNAFDEVNYEITTYNVGDELLKRGNRATIKEA